MTRALQDALGRPLASAGIALEDALAARDSGAAITAVVDGVAAGQGVDAVIDALVADRLERDAGGLGMWVALLDDARRAAQDQDELRRALPIAIAAGWLAEATPGAAATDAAVESATLDRLRDEAASEVEAALVGQLYGDVGRLGALAPVVAAVVELRPACAPEVAARLLARLAGTLAATPQTDVAAEHVARVEKIVASREPIFAAQQAERAAAFQEARFRAHLTDGEAAAAERAMAKAAAYGVPRALLAGSLGLAAAERMLRFDAGLDAAVFRRVGWADVAWLLRVVEAVRRLEVRHGAPGWIDLLLWATWLVQDFGRYDLAAERRPALPDAAVLAQTWDHGPEIARVVAAIGDGDGPGASAALRGYLMMGLPEAPLAASLVEAAFLDPRAGSGVALAGAVGVMTAAAGLFAGVGTNPHRERALLAAVRYLTSARADAPLATLTLRLLDLREGGRSARRLEPLPWGSDDLASAVVA